MFILYPFYFLHKSYTDFFQESIYLSECSTRVTSSTINYIHNCVFSNNINIPFNGSCISIKSSMKLVIEQCFFYDCSISLTAGGAIFFSNFQTGQCVISKCCCFNCKTGLGTSSDDGGQFSNIFCGPNGKNFHFYVSVTKCNDDSIIRRSVITLSGGNIEMNNNNLSLNRCSVCSGTTFQYFSSAIVKFSTYSNNYANSALSDIISNCIYVLDHLANFSYINIIGNESPTKSICYSNFGATINFFYCIFIYNKNTLFIKSDNSKIFLFNCLINHQFLIDIFTGYEIFYNPKTYYYDFFITELCPHMTKNIKHRSIYGLLNRIKYELFK